MKIDGSVNGLAARHLSNALGRSVDVIAASLPVPDPAGIYAKTQTVMTSFGAFTIGWRGGRYDVLANGAVVGHGPV